MDECSYSTLTRKNVGILSNNITFDGKKEKWKSLYAHA